MPYAFLLALLLSLITTNAAAAITTSTSPMPMEQGINQILQQFGENINFGIAIQDPKTGAVLYQKNPSRYYSPASNQKILTAYTTLSALGPGFRYATELLTDQNQNVYLRFSG